MQVSRVPESSANFTPTKRFFVEMLTRDIELEDAILDLLDNCLDGVARSQKKDPSEIDYHGYKAEINFDKRSFSITDNCGGIPKDSAEYAFRMGRPHDAPDEHLATVGVYGIGMKRSIFKIGRNCEIATHHDNDDGFMLNINEDWLDDDLNWRLPMQQLLLPDIEHGTRIKISRILPSVSNEFKTTAFQTSLINKIIYAYSYIVVVY